MATVAFPAGYNLERSSSFSYDHGVEVDETDDGWFVQRDIGSNTWVTIGCEWKYLTLGEKDTLVGFIRDNKMNQIVWTVDGTLYVGAFRGGVKESMHGPRYSVQAEFYGVEFGL